MRISMLFCRLCQQEKLPMTFQSCVITKECQVSEWSEWSPCSKTCQDTVSPKGTRIRTRIIRQLPIGSEEECPELEETEPCVSQGEAAAPCATWVNKAAASAAISAKMASLFKFSWRVSWEIVIFTNSNSEKKISRYKHYPKKKWFYLIKVSLASWISKSP